MGMEIDTNMMGWCECDYRNERVYYDLLGIPYPVPEKVVTTTSANSSCSRSDVGAWGLRSHYDELEGRAVGLCTESLGSESMFDDSSASEEDVDDVNRRIVEEEEEKNKPKGWRPRRGEEEIGKPRQFPPPLPSLLQGGSTPRSCSFMKAVRKDRRLVLTEFTIQRPEILRAKREDGRLQLRLVTWPEEEISGAQEAEGQDVEKEEEEVRPEDEDDYGDEEEEVDDRWRWSAEEDDSLLMMRFGDQMSYGRSNMNKIEEFWRNNPRYVTTA